jgi:mRNA-degrading endonuclease toxin of MazEF toxin-antitoxin module
VTETELAGYKNGEAHSTRVMQVFLGCFVPAGDCCRERMDRDPEAPQGPFPDTFKQGDIFWIEADPSRGSIPGSPHPHVVVQDDVFNRSRISTVIVCALTSNLNRATEPGNVLLEPGEGNLEKQSVVSCVAGVFGVQNASGRAHRDAVG